MYFYLRQALVVKCEVCGEENEPRNFCENCGAALGLDYPDANSTQNLFFSKKSHLWERLSLILFRNDVREDICQNDYNLEALFLLLFNLFLIILLNYYSYIRYSSSYSIKDYLAGNSIVAIILSFFIPFSLTIFFSYLIGLVFKTRITVWQVFRINSYTFFPTLILIAIFIFGLGSLILGPLSNSLVIPLILLTVPLAIGYRTLFKTNIFIAILISGVVTFVSYFLLAYGML